MLSAKCEAMNAGPVTMTALEGFPPFRPGDDIAEILRDALERSHLVPADQDIILVAQKIVSKAEGRFVNLDDVSPSKDAMELAKATGKEARQVEVILSESDDILRHKEGVIVAAHKLGLVLANAGIDRSNVEQETSGERVLLLPVDPDRSASEIKARLDRHFNADIGVIISDSVGRPWRLGTVGLAIGAAGVPSLMDLRGQPDLNGRPLEVAMTGFADGVSAVAELLMGEGAEGRPVVLVQGLQWDEPDLPASALVRPKDEDMFR